MRNLIIYKQLKNTFIITPCLENAIISFKWNLHVFMVLLFGITIKH